MRLTGGSLSETESTAHTVQVMGEIPESLCLMVQRKGVEKPGPKDPNQPMQVEVEMQGLKKILKSLE